MDLRVHGGVGLLVVLGEAVQVPAAEPEEAKDLGVGLLRAGQKLLRPEGE